jgi:hypothetical protein
MFVSFVVFFLALIPFEFVYLNSNLNKVINKCLRSEQKNPDSHSLFQDKVIFKNVGLAVTDEQQRFERYDL